MFNRFSLNLYSEADSSRQPVDYPQSPAFTPAKINSTLADDVGTGTYILDHPDVLRVFNSWVMLTPTTALVGGIHVTLRNP